MQWIWITLGLMLLTMAALLTWLLRRRSMEAFCRIPPHRKLLRLLRRTASQPADSQDMLALQEHALQLMEQIHQLHDRLRQTPSLPSSSEGEPRLMELARDAADSDHFTLDALLRSLTHWEQPATAMEVSAFPACVGAAQCQRLSLVLRTIRSDAKLRRRANKLAPRLLRSKKPYALLDKAGLNSLGLAALGRALRQTNQPEALVLLDRWLAVHDITAEALAQQDDQRQLQLAEELRRAASCLRCLENLPWPEHCEAADALHALLMNDPAGIYPMMDAASRQQLRHQAEALSRRVHMDAAEVIRHALLLCEDAEPRALERYVGYWLQDAAGMKHLHRTLPTRRGRWYARFAARPESLRYLLLWLFGGFAGFCFLHSGQPVFMLPFFALVAGDVIRLAVNRIPRPALPCMAADAIPTHVRTLVVLPALLHDPHEAIRMVRQLKTASHAFQQDHVEYLLLGDFPPAMTAVSSMDGPIMQSAATAVAALADELPLHYIQRGRIWDGDRHTYCAPGGRSGAIGELCRLIVQGECADVIAWATLEPAALERRFDYLYVLSPQQSSLPGTLQRLLQTMTHPLCSRYPTGTGWRGFSVLSPGASAVYEGVGLLQPDAYLEATDGLLHPTLDANALLGELAGHACSSGSPDRAQTHAFSWDSLLAQARRAWQLLPWQLPWVKTPSAVINNPLSKQGRFRLRELLRQALLPLGQYLLLLWAVLTQNWLLLLFSLAAPELRHFAPRLHWLIKALCRLAMLPGRMLLPLLPLWDLLRRKATSSTMTPAVEVWAQGLSATLFATLGLVMPGMAVPALLLSAGFACFPLAHRVLDAPITPADPLTANQQLLLEDVAASTWRFFDAHTVAQTLPPAFVQFEPGQLTAPYTTPEAIGAYLLACVCAKELGYLSAGAAATRLRDTLAALRELPLPFGLPCQQYALPSLTVTDARVSAGAVGFLAAALMTAAQALRTWLPELPTALANVSADAEAVLSSLDLAALYDPASRRFHAGLDEHGQPTGSIRCFADDGLLLVIAACARKLVPADCLRRLSRTRVRLGKQELLLSHHGTATEQLLAGLFLPIDGPTARAYIQAMANRSQEGLWGQGECSVWRFDAHLHYQNATFGVQETAVSPTASAPVYAPYAAALALPFLPGMAAGALARFCEMGAKGPEGLCDAIDLSTGASLVGLHSTFHQGLILLAAAHCLADEPALRYFCALPEVEACLPLLTDTCPSHILPALPVRRLGEQVHPNTPTPVDHHLLPVQMQLLGNDQFHLMTDAHGAARMTDGHIPLNRAFHLYLLDEGRIYPLGDPHLQGQTVFTPGESRYEQLCGSLRSELLHCADTLRRRSLHVVTITNLSTRDRIIELADCLLPDLGAAPNTLEATRPSSEWLTLHARGTSHSLHHTVSASAAPLQCAACTDAEFFLGQSRSLTRPASLEQPMRDHLAASADPCLSFRGRYAIGGRGQITIWFTTSLAAGSLPLLTELSGIRQLAAMQGDAIRASAAVSPQQRQMAQMLLAPLQRSGWRVSLLADAPASAAMTDLLVILGWLMLHGQRAHLIIHCEEHLRESITEQVRATLADELVTFAAPDEAPAPLAFASSIPLLNQLTAHQSRIAQPAPAMKPPRPARLPVLELLHKGEYGGFDPQTNDYVLQLEPGQRPPIPWTNLHKTRRFQESTDDAGLHTPFEEEVFLRTEDGTLLSPFSQELPRAIRMRPGETDWEAWADQLDLRLRTACMPGHRCGLRVLHLHNPTDMPLHLHVSVTATLPHESLVCLPGLVMSDQPVLPRQAFIAGDGWQAAITSHADVAHAQLSCEIQLPPGRSAKMAWLAGYARHGEDVARALDALRASTASQLLRTSQASWTQHLSALTFSTPEPTLDLLVNRILPVQALNIAGLPALKYIAPMAARRELLRQARQPMSRDEWAHFILLLADYIRVTGDEKLLHVHLPAQEASLLSCCRDALLHAPLDRQHLPQGDDQAKRCFLYALAAQALDSLAPEPELLEFSRQLLNAADTYLWQDGYYGTPLRLDVQSLACAAYGANPRTRQAISTCWTTLYDAPHGLIRSQESTDAPPLPGLPENGGMVTANAVRCLRALFRAARHDEAFELLRALNPLHHTDTPERQATFRCPPYQLHSGMYAAPMEVGRAVPGGDEAAALLYAIILEDMLGLQLRGNILQVNPCVPLDWDDFSLTLRVGASTWHISAERRLQQLTIDGKPAPGNAITLIDDGKVHQARFPLA